MAAIQIQQAGSTTGRALVAGGTLVLAAMLAGWLAYGGLSDDVRPSTPRSFSELLEELEASEVAAEECRELVEIVARCLP